MTNPTLERAEQAAKCEIDRLRKRRVEVAPGRFADGLGWENLDEIVSTTTHAVLMAVLPTLERYDSDYAGEYKDERGDYVRYADLQAILNDGEGE